jgi:hypothetical protein
LLAKVLVIGVSTGDAVFQLSLSASSEGLRKKHSHYTQSGLTMPILKSHMAEIDVTEILNQAAPSQDDYLSLNFANVEGDARLVGLRFQYEGPAGPAGPKGDTGATGPQGAAGPAGAPLGNCTDDVTKTNLLFSYVTAADGIDTGISISNTGADPFGTIDAKSGTCTLHFYGTAQGTPNTTTTASIAIGTTYAELASSLKPGFRGYVIANCDLPYAHGLALMSDTGLRNWATAYLGLVICSKRIPPEGLLP